MGGRDDALHALVLVICVSGDWGQGSSDGVFNCKPGLRDRVHTINETNLLIASYFNKIAAA